MSINLPVIVISSPLSTGNPGDNANVNVLFVYDVTVKCVV
jgi:hypothetical protein